MLEVSLAGGGRRPAREIAGGDFRNFVRLGIRPADDPIVLKESNSCSLPRITAFEEGIGTLLEIDAFAQHAVSQPVVLVEVVRSH
jgi:hypothetical protein